MANEADIELLAEACIAAYSAAKVLGRPDIEALLRIVLLLVADEIVAIDSRDDDPPVPH